MVLNEMNIKTTNGFNVNNVTLDLELPKNPKFKEYETSSKINIKYGKSKITSKIGVSIDEALSLDIVIKENINEPVILSYELDDALINNINIHYLENTKADLVFKYTSKKKVFNYIKYNILMDKYSTGNISIINLLDNSSTNLIASESNLSDFSFLKQNLIDISGNIRIYNFNSIVNDNAKSYLNNLYLGKDKNLIDMNYNYQNIGENSVTNISVEGALDDNATKTFRGTIDLNHGNNADGRELENCLLLSDKAISKSVPILLCNEENVSGSHAVSTGKIDSDKLFYLMSKGISLEEAKSLIIMANFNKIIKELDNSELEELVINHISNCL